MDTHPVQCVAISVYATQNEQLLADLQRRITAAIARKTDPLHKVLLQVAELFNREQVSIQISIAADNHRCGMLNAEA